MAWHHDVRRFSIEEAGQFSENDRYIVRYFINFISLMSRVRAEKVCLGGWRSREEEGGQSDCDDHHSVPSGLDYVQH